MAYKKVHNVPRYGELIAPTFNAIKILGGSATNEEILKRIILDLNLENEIVDYAHLGSTNMTELQYQLAWARTYLKNYGAIENSGRCVWAIAPKFFDKKFIDARKVISYLQKKNGSNDESDNLNINESLPPEDTDPQNDALEYPEEAKPWKMQLAEIISNMDPFAFERLSQRLLRECGFSQVEVTKKTGDGGIDGTGKLRINGIFSFNVAFQCKRFKGQVSSSDIRDFRGSLTTDIEKGVLITTGTFSKTAREEASNPGKQQIDLIDGEEFMNKLAEYRIGISEITVLKVDEGFFKSI